MTTCTSCPSRTAARARSTRSSQRAAGRPCRPRPGIRWGGRWRHASCATTAASAGPWWSSPRRPACRSWPHEDRDALTASTFGTGQVLAAAIGLGCREILLGVGGSATTDGGAGLLTALGARFLDASGTEVPPGGVGLERLATRRPGRPLTGPGRGQPHDRLGRQQPAARRARRGRHLRPAEGRLARRRATAGPRPYALRGRARGDHRPRRPRRAGRRRGGRHDGRPAGHRRPLREPRRAAGGRRGHEPRGLRGRSPPQRPGPDRRGPRRCSDTLRQDGSGRRRTGAGGRRALPLLRGRGHTRGRGDPRRGRRHRRPRRGDPDLRRGGDGRGAGACRAGGGAHRPARRPAGLLDR